MQKLDGAIKSVNEGGNEGRSMKMSDSTNDYLVVVKTTFHLVSL